MNWRDLLYFSKGERQALTILLILITIAFILLLINDKRGENTAIADTQYIVNPANAPVPIEVDSVTKLLPEKNNRAIPPQTFSPEDKNKTFIKRNTKSFSGKTDKYAVGTIVELNTADTVILKKVPGIGSVFARRIVKYRDLLGGFYSVAQLQEIYGLDEERYQSLKAWFYADASFIAKLPVNQLSYEQLIKHPYLNSKQTRAICQLRKQKGTLSGWENLHLLDEFTDSDKQRLQAYLLF